MRIEDCWNDKKAYYITFQTKDNRQVGRLILVSPEMEALKDIERLVFSNFNRVKSILAIDEWGDALVLK